MSTVTHRCELARLLAFGSKDVPYREGDVGRADGVAGNERIDRLLVPRDRHHIPRTTSDKHNLCTWTLHGGCALLARSPMIEK